MGYQGVVIEQQPEAIVRVRVTAGAVLAAVIGFFALQTPSAFAEATTSDYGSRLVTLINQARADHGLHALTVTSGTSTVAANWAAHMSQQQALSHNPNLASQLESHGSPNWTTYGENVAAGSPSSADQMFQDYMNSPEHRDNILNSHYRYVGVGTVFADSFAWNTLDFVDQYSSTTTQSSTSTTTTTTKPSTTTTKPATTSKPTATQTSATQRTATQRTAPKTTTATAPKPTTRTVVATAQRSVAVQHSAPRPAAARSHAVAHTTSTTHTAAVAAPAVAHAAAAPSPVALSTPVHSGNGHTNNTPVLVALTVLLLVALRLTVAVTMRRRTR